MSMPMKLPTAWLIFDRRLQQRIPGAYARQMRRAAEHDARMMNKRERQPGRFVVISLEDLRAGRDQHGG